LIVSIKHADPDNNISGPSVPISPPSPNNRQITMSPRRHEISHKLDSEDTMKASDSETVINLSQYGFFIPRLLSTACPEAFGKIQEAVSRHSSILFAFHSFVFVWFSFFCFCLLLLIFRAFIFLSQAQFGSINTTSPSAQMLPSSPYHLPTFSLPILASR
jgi:hypothetical protein